MSRILRAGCLSPRETSNSAVWQRCLKERARRIPRNKSKHLALIRYRNVALKLKPTAIVLKTKVCIENNFVKNENNFAAVSKQELSGSRTHLVACSLLFAPSNSTLRSFHLLALVLFSQFHSFILCRFVLFSGQLKGWSRCLFDDSSLFHCFRLKFFVILLSKSEIITLFATEPGF